MDLPSGPPNEVQGGVGQCRVLVPNLKQCPLPRLGKSHGKSHAFTREGHTLEGIEVRQHKRFQTLLRARVVSSLRGAEKLSSSSWDQKVSRLWGEVLTFSAPSELLLALLQMGLLRHWCLSTSLKWGHTLSTGPPRDGYTWRFSSQSLPTRPTGASLQGCPKMT